MYAPDRRKLGARLSLHLEVAFVILAFVRLDSSLQSYQLIQVLLGPAVLGQRIHVDVDIV